MTILCNYATRACKSAECTFERSQIFVWFNELNAKKSKYLYVRIWVLCSKNLVNFQVSQGKYSLIRISILLCKKFTAYPLFLLFMKSFDFNVRNTLGGLQISCRGAMVFRKNNYLIFCLIGPWLEPSSYHVSIQCHLLCCCGCK